MTKDEKAIVKYLTGNEGDPKSVKFDLEKGECKKIGLDRYFGTSLDCKHYDSAVSGEGNEKDKIDTIYSSSLQSLLVFDSVSEENVIKIDFNGKDLEFNEVLFEYENPVIGYPSSIDVVLLNRRDMRICFIESKLFEIIRDSSKEGKNVVGISYFRANGTGYKNTLHLSIDNDLDRLAIEHPETYLEVYKGLPKENGGGNKRINRCGNNEYVYSDGIKQILSHLIGICNFKDSEQESAYKNTADPLAGCKGFRTYYLELYNALPELCESNSEFGKKINDFKAHVEKVFEVLQEEDKNLDIAMKIWSYQELYKHNSKKSDDYCSKLSEKIIQFYKLNK